jgi:hypothetical protein
VNINWCYSSGDDDERVDFEIGELQVDVYAVKSDDEIDEDVLGFLWDFREELLLEDGNRRERVRRSNQ